MGHSQSCQVIMVTLIKALLTNEVQNGKITGLKLCVPPPPLKTSRQGKTFHAPPPPPLSRVETFRAPTFNMAKTSSYHIKATPKLVVPPPFSMAKTFSVKKTNHMRLRKVHQMILFFINCMFYQLLRVQHSCSSTQFWDSVLPSIVEMRDQNSRGCPLLFSNRNLGSFCAQGTEILYTHSLWEVVDHSRSKMHETCLIIIHDPGMRPGPESNRGPLD